MTYDILCFNRQHDADGLWAEAPIVQAAADFYGLDIYVTYFYRNGAQQTVRARSAQAVDSPRWLHLRLQTDHYDIISGTVNPSGADKLTALLLVNR
jgi:hypothetical protein